MLTVKWKNQTSKQELHCYDEGWLQQKWDQGVGGVWKVMESFMEEMVQEAPLKGTGDLWRNGRARSAAGKVWGEPGDEDLKFVH